MILRFADPAYLVLLLGVPLLAWWYVARGRGRTGSLRYSSLAAVARADRRWSIESVNDRPAKESPYLTTLERNLTLVRDHRGVYVERRV